MGKKEKHDAAAASSAENIKVLVRCRPLNSKERESDYTSCVDLDLSEATVTVNHVCGAPDRWTFDAVINNTYTQKDVFTQYIMPLVDSVLAGFNSTVFAYGQSGSGKTHTMSGKIDDDDLKGIIPRTFQHVFNMIKQFSTTQPNKKFTLYCSFLEIYNGKVRDLLAKQQVTLAIKENKDKTFFVAGAHIPQVKFAEDLYRHIEEGTDHRQVAATELNADSSRSHSIFSLIVECTETTEDGDTRSVTSKLNLVDLAGSERQSKTQASGDTLKEGCNINLSLSALGTVIDTLVKGKGHVPFRSSPLTMLLKDSLGGSSKTIMFANIGPSEHNLSETVSTLRFADRAKQIKNKPVVNMDTKDQKIAELTEQVHDLKEKLKQFETGGMKQLEDELEELQEKVGELEIDRDNAIKGREADSMEFTSIKQSLEAQLEESKRREQTIQETADQLQEDLHAAEDSVRDEQMQRKEILKACSDFLFQSDDDSNNQDHQEIAGVDDLIARFRDKDQGANSEELTLLHSEKHNLEVEVKASKQQYESELGELNAQVAQLQESLKSTERKLHKVKDTLDEERASKKLIMVEAAAAAQGNGESPLKDGGQQQHQRRRSSAAVLSSTQKNSSGEEEEGDSSSGVDNNRDANIITSESSSSPTTGNSNLSSSRPKNGQRKQQQYFAQAEELSARYEGQIKDLKQQVDELQSQASADSRVAELDAELQLMREEHTETVNKLLEELKSTTAALTAVSLTDDNSPATENNNNNDNSSSSSSTKISVLMNLIDEKDTALNASRAQLVTMEGKLEKLTRQLRISHHLTDEEVSKTTREVTEDTHRDGKEALRKELHATAKNRNTLLNYITKQEAVDLATKMQEITKENNELRQKTSESAETVEHLQEQLEKNKRMYLAISGGGGKKKQHHHSHHQHDDKDVETTKENNKEEGSKTVDNNGQEEERDMAMAGSDDDSINNNNNIIFKLQQQIEMLQTALEESREKQMMTEAEIVAKLLDSDHKTHQKKKKKHQKAMMMMMSAGTNKKDATTPKKEQHGEEDAEAEEDDDDDHSHHLATKVVQALQGDKRALLEKVADLERHVSQLQQQGQQQQQTSSSSSPSVFEGGGKGGDETNQHKLSTQQQVVQSPLMNGADPAELRAKASIADIERTEAIKELDALRLEQLEEASAREKLEEKLVAAQLEVKAARGELYEQQKATAQLENRIQEQKAEFARTSSDAASHASQLAQIQGRLKERSDQLAQMRGRFDKQKQIMSSNKEKYDSLVDELTKSKLGMKEQEKQFHQTLIDKEEQIHRAMNKKLELISQDHHNDLAKKDEDIKKMRKKLNKMEAQVQKAKERYDEKVCEYEDLVTRMEDQKVEAMRMMQDSKVVEIQDNQEQIQDVLQRAKEEQKRKKDKFAMGETSSALSNVRAVGGAGQLLAKARYSKGGGGTTPTTLGDSGDDLSDPMMRPRTTQQRPGGSAQRGHRPTDKDLDF